MLQKQAVEPRTFSLLKELMALPCLADGALVGGTALALMFGHRLSVDLDIFLPKKPDWDLIQNELTKYFGKRFVFEKKPVSIGIFCFIDDIKVDIVFYPHPLLEPLYFEEDIRMYSKPDIAAMKINAILGRGKKKDFWDLAELLSNYTLEKIIEFYQKKFPNQQLLISIPNALLYFTDADSSEYPICLKNKTWPQIKKKIEQEVNAYLK